MLIFIRVTYRSKSGAKLIDFNFDCSNAFQATRIDGKDERLTPLYCEQAAGFRQKDSAGNAYVCKVLVAHQGRIDSARLFGQAFHKLMIAAGLRELVYAPKAYMWHAGPLTASSASLGDILTACEGLPAVEGAPSGWACFGQHVDDSAGVASSQSVVDYLMGAIQVTYSCKMTRWDKVLGYTVTINDYEHFSTATISCKPILEAAINRHLRSKGEAVLAHKNPYPSDLKTRLSKGVAPDSESPDYKPFIAMQLECRSLLGLYSFGFQKHTLR